MSVTKEKKIGQMSVTSSEICFSGPFNWRQNKSRQELLTTQI